MEIVNTFMPFSTYVADSRRYSTHSKFSAENCTAVLLQQQQQQQQQHQQQQQIIDQNMIEFQNIDDLLDFSNEEISSVLGTEEAAAAEEEEEESAEEEEEAAGLGSVSNSDQNRINNNNNNNNNHHTNNIGPLLQQQLNDDDLFPSCEDRDELEWLSNFVDESMSSSAAALDGASALFSCCTVGGSNSSSNDHNTSPVDRQKSAGYVSKEEEEEALILSPGYGYHRDNCTVYREKDSVERSAGAGAGTGTGPDASLVRAGGGRPRSKRMRATTGLLSRVWESRVILIDYRSARPSPAENALIESPPSTSTLTDSEDSQVLDFFPYSAAPPLLPPPPPPSGHKKKQKTVVAAATAATPKKKKKKPASASATTVMNMNTNTAMTMSASLSSSSSEVKGGVEVDLSPATARKCLHCATTKTPQWRAGPQGPKTLCNACGVRFKSGRLLPEYRPAASPTFVDCLHSNSHRRVLEMRKQKEGPNDGYESGSGYEEGDADADADYNDDDSCRTTITTTTMHSSWDTP